MMGGGDPMMGGGGSMMGGGGGSMMGGGGGSMMGGSMYVTLFASLPSPADHLAIGRGGPPMDG